MRSNCERGTGNIQELLRALMLEICTHTGNLFGKVWSCMSVKLNKTEKNFPSTIKVYKKAICREKKTLNSTEFNLIR